MHHVRVTFDIHQVADFYRSVFAHAPRSLRPRSTSITCSARSLFVFSHFLFQRGIGGFIFSARMRACYRTVFEF